MKTKYTQNIGRLERERIMIKVNGTEIIVEKYPAGTPRINYGSLFRPSFMVEKGRPSGAVIDWKFEGNDEVFYLILIKKHLDNN